MSRTYRRVCRTPQCGNGREGLFSRDYVEVDGKWKWVLVCNNCGYVARSRKPTQKKVATIIGEITPVQLKCLQNFAEDILRNDALLDPKDYEYKRFEVRLDEGGTVFLTTTVGKKNDVGTWGEYIGRPTRFIWITPTGGCRLTNPSKHARKKKVCGYWNCVRTSVSGGLGT